MNRNSAEQRQGIYLPRLHHSLSEQQDNHRCPYCSKTYRTSTWLENHIKTKHTIGMTQEKSEMLAHMGNSYQNSVNSPMLFSRSFQEPRRPSLAQDLATTVALLKQLSPLLERLHPVLEQLDSVSLRAPFMSRSNSRAPKRCASSPDLRGEGGAKLRELDTSIPEACTAGNQNRPQNYPSVTDSYARTTMISGDPCGTQYTGSRTAFSERNHFTIDSPHHSRRITRHPYLDQAQDSEGVLSYSDTPYFQTPNDGVPQRRHRLRSFRIPGPSSQPDNMTALPHEFLGGHPSPSLFGEKILHQHEYSSDWLNSLEPLLGTMQPEPNVQRSYSVEDPHQEMEHHQSIMQELQQYPASNTRQQITEHIPGDYHTDIFQDWNLSATMDSASTAPAARLGETITERKHHDRSGQCIAGKAPTNSDPGNC